MILSNQKSCRKNWFVQKSLHFKKKHVDPRRFKDWRAFWLTLTRASKGFTAAGQRRNFTVLSPFPSQADPWETSCLNLSPFSPNENRFHICVSKRFADVSPATPLVDYVQPLPTKQDLVAVGFDTAKKETWVTRRKSQWGRGFSTSLSDSWMSMQTCSAKGLELRIPITEWADLSGWPEGKFHQIRLSQEI